MGSQQRSPLMPNEKFPRGPAVSDGPEKPSVRADLVIVLRNEASGEAVIWQREDDPTDNNVPWLTTLLSWGVGG
jgi:hypothetical protein